MTKCANCANEAYFTYAITPTFGIHYCSRHVPRFLAKQKNIGMLPLRVEAPVVTEATPTKKSKAKAEPVVEPEPEVVEEVVEVDEPSEEIAPE